MRPASIAAAAADLAAVAREMPDLAAHYPTLATPTAILFGRNDAILDPVLHGRRTADGIPGARLTLIDGGHMIPVTAPEETIRFVREASARFA